MKTEKPMRLPPSRVPASAADQFVAEADRKQLVAPPRPTPQQTEATGKIVKLTVDLPEELHTDFKSLTAKRRTKMITVIRTKIEEWMRENG
jgi:ParG